MSTLNHLIVVATVALAGAAMAADEKTQPNAAAKTSMTASKEAADPAAPRKGTLQTPAGAQRITPTRSPTETIDSIPALNLALPPITPGC